MKKILSIFPFILLIFAVSFNLFFLFPETKIKSEVNDNVFAFALINRMNIAWDEGKCPLSLNCLPQLLDHWNSQWAMGFPLPHFYQHIPDLAVVITYRILKDAPTGASLWDIFEWFKYLMLSFVPLSYFISAKKFGLNNLTAGFTALISTQISTQYLYGTDYNSLVWRGSGMFTQLWGIFFLPLAVSSIYKFLASIRNSQLENSQFFQSILFLSLTISSHVVFGFIALASSLLILASQGVSLRSYFSRLFTLFLSSFILLAYWLLPLLQHSYLRNKSIWDDINKFDSFGFQQITKWFLNGDLFDANRLPVLTLIVIIGLFLMLYLWSKSKEIRNSQLENSQLLFFPVLFIFWFLLYFGRKTWGPLIDIIPLMEDMHIHRLINGLHFSGIFIIGITLAYIIENFNGYAARIFSGAARKIFRAQSSEAPPKAEAKGVSTAKFCCEPEKFDLFKIFCLILILVILIPVFKERKEYLEYNTKLITDYNVNWEKDNKDFQKVLDFLGPPPLASRIYPGRPGNWGANFFVGSTKVYLELSQRGYDVFAFLPETWSLNSDIEQYFDENKEDHYNVFNVGYFLAPSDQKPPSFAKKVFQSGKYNLYKIESSKNFEFIQSPFAISVNKKTYLNPQVAWLRSDWPKNHLFPTIIYNKKNCPLSIVNCQLITMLDSSTYKIKDDIFPLLNPNPFNQKINSQLDNSQFAIKSESITPSSYSAIINSQLDNSQLLLKATFHPYWQAKITNLDNSQLDNSQFAIINMVSPSFMSIQVPPGSHKVEFTYQPSQFKIGLIYLSFISLISLIFLIPPINSKFRRFFV